MLKSVRGRNLVLGFAVSFLFLYALHKKCQDKSSVVLTSQINHKGVSLHRRLSIAEIRHLYRQLDGTLSVVAEKPIQGQLEAFPDKLASYRALCFEREIKVICESGFDVGARAVFL